MTAELRPERLLVQDSDMVKVWQSLVYLVYLMFLIVIFICISNHHSNYDFIDFIILCASL